MTRTEFILKWRRVMAAEMLFGTHAALREGPLTQASRALDIPAEADRLLGMMFDDIIPPPPPKPKPAEKPATNGAQAPATKKV